MTTESKIILNAETGQSVNNVKELQYDIKGYKEALIDENATAEQNKETAAALAQAQGVLVLMTKFFDPEEFDYHLHR